MDPTVIGVRQERCQRRRLRAAALDQRRAWANGNGRGMLPLAVVVMPGRLAPRCPQIEGDRQERYQDDRLRAVPLLARPP